MYGQVVGAGTGDVGWTSR